MENLNNEILNEIKKTLNEINVRQDVSELFSESDSLMKQSDNRVEYATNQIQNSFDRIHDKAFSFNNIMIGLSIILCSFPSDAPKLELWSIVFLIINLIFIVYLDIRQMNIHRFATNEQKWTSIEIKEYGNKIISQTNLSLFALVLSFAYLIYIIIVLI